MTLVCNIDYGLKHVMTKDHKRDLNSLVNDLLPIIMFYKTEIYYYQLM